MLISYAAQLLEKLLLCNIGRKTIFLQYSTLQLQILNLSLKNLQCEMTKFQQIDACNMFIADLMDNFAFESEATL